MEWDGLSINGMISPGPESIPFTLASLDPSTWTVHIEADAKDPSGNTIQIIIDGKLENIGSYHRTIEGTWTQGTTQGGFTLTRD